MGFCAPGVLEVRDGVVWLGADAGLPRTTPLFTWKSGMALADVRALPEDVRRAAAIELPEEERARIEADEREMEEAMQEAGARWSVTPRDPSLAWREQARLLPISKRQAEVLDALGAPYFEAGYTRTSEVLYVGRAGQPMSYVWRDETSFRTPRHRRAFEATWADRVFRALTDDVVTEPAVSFAKRTEESWGFDERVVDDADTAAAERARASIEAQEDAVELPRGGTVWRVPLPAFEVKLCHDPIRFVVPENVREAFTVPARDVWALRGPELGR